jgi:4-amino-4-deoxy-L-arabinose transferase-like glycosyltransferase
MSELDPAHAGRTAATGSRSGSGSKWLTVGGLTALLWGMHLVWLRRDTRPPVWDMAMHQTYALNYLSVRPAGPGLRPGSRTGDYPPFVHWMIALSYRVFHPGPKIAVLANIPATVILFWAIYTLGQELAGATAARWACVIAALTPYLIWMSRETALDYWLSAWVATAWVLLLRTRGFERQAESLAAGLVSGLGLLTKWLFAGFLVFPLVYVALRGRIWRERARAIHLADMALVAAAVSAVWYAGNVSRLVRYFAENAAIGAEEGEPPVLSLQSFVYYLRLLEGYQLFALLSAVAAIAAYQCWRRRLLTDGAFVASALGGGWLVLTLLRTKDPRFSMPLLALVAVVCGAALAAWRPSRGALACKTVLLVLLGVQAYAANFGIRWLPDAVVIARGYQGTLRWDWNLYLQHYFNILGRPRREDWRQAEILRRMKDDAALSGTVLSLAIVPDLPRFSAANFQLYGRLLGIPVRVDHPRSRGDAPFDGYDYAVLVDGDQGIAWTTGESRALSRRIVDDPESFRLVDLFALPNGDTARLYSVERARR